MSTPAFYLIGHSHAIAVLDAVTDWREQRRTEQVGTSDPRYAELYQEWLRGTTPGEPFTTRVKSMPLADSISTTVWLLSPGNNQKSLVTMITMPDTSVTLRINSPFDLYLEKWQGHTPIISMLCGNEHSQHIIRTSIDYDFIEHDVPEIASFTQMIDGHFIDSQIDAWVKAVSLPLLAVRKSIENPICHILPPPPRAHPQLTRHLEGYKDLVERYGFAPDQLRLKWYRRYCRLLTQQLNSFGIDVLPAPGEAIQQDGLLLEGYAEGLTHGNVAYGHCVVCQILAWLQQISSHRL